MPDEKKRLPAITSSKVSPRCIEPVGTGERRPSKGPLITTGKIEAVQARNASQQFAAENLNDKVAVEVGKPINVGADGNKKAGRPKKG